MSNPLLDAVYQVQENNDKSAKEAEAAKETRLKILETGIKNIFLLEVWESFQNISLTKNGDYFNFKATVFFGKIPVILTFEVLNTFFVPVRIYAGSGGPLQNSPSVVIPNENDLANNERLEKLQKENSSKLIYSLANVAKSIEAMKISKPGWWKTEIPRNLYGAHLAPKLLENLELDKPFLSKELYEECLGVLTRIIVEKKEQDQKESDQYSLFAQIVKEEKERARIEWADFEDKMTKLALKLGEQYFKPWTMYTVTYMAENLDITAFRDEEGELVDDLQSVLTFTCNAITPPDMEGYRKIVDAYGAVRDRKISTNIVHIDRTEFNEYPFKGGSYVSFWKRVFVDKNRHYCFYVPPMTEVADFSYLVPTAPKTMEEGAKERGVVEAWRYAEK